VTLNIKLDEEKSEYSSLAQQIGFGRAFLYTLLRLEKGIAQLCIEECNKYNLPAAPCF
jgi:hypothetical protein